MPDTLVRIAATILAVLIAAPATAGGEAPRYRLGEGDRLKVRVHGHDRLSSEVEVDARGAISLPLVDTVQVAGLTVAAAETRIVKAYAPDYLTDPSVSVSVLNYRPVFVLGEVKDPGSYAYERGLTVMESVAMAGGYTYRADTDAIEIVRSNAEKARPATETTRVLPGDTVRVGQRFF